MSVLIRDMDKADRCEDCRLLQTYQEHPFASVEMWCGVTDETIDNMQNILPNCPITEISEYTMKNGHKVVVADTPQTERCYKEADVVRVVENVKRGYGLTKTAEEIVADMQTETQTETQNSNDDFPSSLEDWEDEYTEHDRVDCSWK